jgi:hypothetical protein
MEAQQNKRGRGGPSSDEGSDEDERPRRKNKVEDEDEDDTFELSADYRDRAKERREGKPSGGPTGKTTRCNCKIIIFFLPRGWMFLLPARFARK